jgi:hypothetical protein
MTTRDAARAAARPVVERGLFDGRLRRVGDGADRRASGQPITGQRVLVYAGASL